MERCKTCLYWRHCRECDYPNIAHPQIKATPEELFEVRVWVADDHGLEVSIRTGPEFGCLHHTCRCNVCEDGRVRERRRVGYDIQYVVEVCSRCRGTGVLKLNAESEDTDVGL